MAQLGGTAGSAAVSPMMYLRPDNSVVLDELKRRLDPEAPTPTEPVDLRLTDFDGVY